MKRPFAVLGFSMLSVSLILCKLSVKAIVAVVISATVVFCFLLLFKWVRQDKTALFSLFAVIIFSLSLLTSQYKFYSISGEVKDKEVSAEGVVCEAPSSSDYAASYIIRINELNGKRTDFKIRYITESGTQFKQGDKVKGNILPAENPQDTDYLESNLSSRIYFTCFETDSNFLSHTGEYSPFYKITGEIKAYLANVTNSYLPNENGAVANAVSIGEKSGISSYTFECFKYAGTVHLLVISGLHLTVWSVGIMHFLSKISRIRKYTPIIGILCLTVYCAITGFSVSVIRAGVMIGTVLLGKVFHRDADSINSMGTALVFILLLNPFSTYSVSLWFTILSTIGIIVAGRVLKARIFQSRIGTLLGKNPVFVFIAETAAVSISAGIFTMPVFIVKYNTMPVTSVISNLFMMQPAMFLMFLTVFGLLAHCLHLYPIAEALYAICGALAEFLRKTAEFIGMSRFSTISVSHRYYKYFLVLMLASAGIILLCRKLNINITRHICTFLAVTFVLVSTYCTVYDVRNPSLEIVGETDNQVLILKAEGQCIVIGCPQKRQLNSVQDAMERHNMKCANCLVLTESVKNNLAQITNAEKELRAEKTVSCQNGCSSPVYIEGNIDEVTVGGNVTADLSNTSKYIEISYGDKQILLINGNNPKDILQKGSKYDIIILCGDGAESCRNYTSKFLKTDKSQIYIPDDNGLSIYF